MNVGSNSIRCTSCQKSVQESMSKVMKSFTLFVEVVSNTVTITGCTSVDIGAIAICS